jgi:hypothetical protein
MSGHVGLHGNPPSRGPARRKENRRFVREYGQDLGLSPLRPSTTMVGPVQNVQFEYKEEFPISHLDASERVVHSRNTCSIFGFFLGNGRILAYSH